MVSNRHSRQNAFGFARSTVVQIEFLEWTEAGRLSHSKFGRLRDEGVVKEHVRRLHTPVICRFMKST